MSGVDERFEQLAQACGPRVLAYLARRTDPPADAADVYQLVLMTTWRRLERVPTGNEEALAWMLAVARRCLANHRRNSGRRLNATARLRSVVTVQPATDDRDGPSIRDALDKLGEDDRELLTLVYWDDLSCEQVATVVGISGAAARKRLQRARDRLRAVMAEELAVEHESACPAT